MIVKEKEPTAPTDRFSKAGDAAERQMAHYLRRAFGDDPHTWVYNDLRLPLDDDAVQIDHLVIHRWGMVIVESKSVSGRVAVNARGEWIRIFGRDRTGMPSPIEQARRQADALRKILQAHRQQLRDRALLGLIQGGFVNCPMDILVAISDGGIIERRGFNGPEVVKADQVAGIIQATIDRHRRASSLLNLKDTGPDGLWSLNAAEAERIANFLLARHTPLRRAAAAPAPQPPAPPARSPAPARAAPPPAPPAAAVALEALACAKCRSINVRIVHARYGYCLKCGECGGFTPLDRTCTACGRKARITKSGPEFRRVCAATPDADGCGAEVLFFQNPDDT